MEEQLEEATEQELAAFGLERLSSGARKALATAKEIASALGDGFIGTEHLLLGLSQTPSGAASQVLQALQLTPDRLVDAIRFIRGEKSGHESTSNDERRFSPRLVHVLALANKEAAERGDREVGTIHMLMGLLRVREGLPVFLLESAGLGPKRVDLIIDRACRSGLTDHEGSRSDTAPEHNR